MTRSKQLMYSYIVAKYKTVNHERKWKITKKENQATKKRNDEEEQTFPNKICRFT